MECYSKFQKSIALHPYNPNSAYIIPYQKMDFRCNFQLNIFHCPCIIFLHMGLSEYKIQMNISHFPYT